MQLTHYNTNFKPRTFPIILICDNVTNAPHIGSLFRIADAFGVEKLVLCGETIPIGRKMTKTSRATEKIVPYEWHENTFDIVETYKNNDYQIVSLEITSKSKPINNFKFSKDYQTALVIGDENFGISEHILKISDAIVHIDMFGKNSSMNVVQATNIALYEMTKQLI